MKNKDQFSIRTPEYLESYDPFHNSISLNQIAINIQEQIKVKGDSLRCLDSMAGTGIVGRKMREVFSGIEVVFQDKSPGMLSSDAYQNDERILSDVTAIGVSGELFDIIFCRGGLNNLGEDDYPKALREYLRVLRNDGIIILQDHFAKTEEAKEAINQIEAEVANIEGRSDKTYVPTIEELRGLVVGDEGVFSNEQAFEICLSMKDRFVSKGIDNFDLSKISKILEGQKTIEYEKVEDDIILVYPIFTITFKKVAPIVKKSVYERTNADRAIEFLEDENQNGFFSSYVNIARDAESLQRAPNEVFSSIVITDTLFKNRPDSELASNFQYIEKHAQQGQLTFFEDRNLLPPDTDTNSLGYSVLLENRRVDSAVVNEIFDAILAYMDSNGIVQVWFSKDRPNHLDCVVATNATYFAYLLNRGDEIKRTEDWLIAVLDSGQYLEGSRYYHSPDSFLYFLGRLMKFPRIAEKIQVKLGQHLQKRIGETDYPLDLAMRVILSDSLGIQNDSEKQKLMELQGQDGSWPTDALYREGRKLIFYGNKSIPTAFSIKALNH